MAIVRDERPGIATQADRTRAAAILARLDRLPSTRHVWLLITMLSLGIAALRTEGVL